MTALDPVFSDGRRAVGEMIAAAAATGANFKTPRGSGKWSPSQIVEHVAIALEESGNVAAGQPSKFPTLPFFLRPIIRVVFFNRILQSGRFPRARAPKSLSPDAGPASAADARVRLEAALARLERACRARTDGTVDSPIVGVVRVEDFARFQIHHLRHHTRQIQ